MNISTCPIIKLTQIVLLIFGFCLFQPLSAQKHNQKSAHWTFGYGNAYIFDDYLSPLPHKGGSILFTSGMTNPLKWGLPDSLENTFENAKWFSQIDFTLNPAYAINAPGSGIFHGNMDLRKTILRQLITQPSMNVAFGGYIALGGGGRFCAINGNNPGSIDIYSNLGMSVLSNYNFNLWRKSFRLSYQGSLALAGLAFSPEYAESYYEIFYLGNRQNILKFTNPINNQQWRQQLNLDIPFTGRLSSIRLSYQNDGHVSLLNKIHTRILSNHFSVGYIRYFNIL